MKKRHSLPPWDKLPIAFSKLSTAIVYHSIKSSSPTKVLPSEGIYTLPCSFLTGSTLAKFLHRHSQDQRVTVRGCSPFRRIAGFPFLATNCFRKLINHSLLRRTKRVSEWDNPNHQDETSQQPIVSLHRHI
ncbi:hypothetical protein SJAG_06591 [Schizosaccharomyces japonicus yFS275]|uniref:Uncharacterized protein n=1 Tax=Schizosaccharomyces japonicus (strain yFS275 / FY16936) TaxID=402676 RepID=T0S180_SCHJY|nr:hypothetical protein SJAG_06591 [Schizosaccharomyces japonicus yFS275]EQC53067.1 hypothetical protein SJAG_06591 [Schizosaccharomyces japonicus yFS275]